MRSNSVNDKISYLGWNHPLEILLPYSNTMLISMAYDNREKWLVPELLPKFEKFSLMSKVDKISFSEEITQRLDISSYERKRILANMAELTKNDPLGQKIKVLVSNAKIANLIQLSTVTDIVDAHAMGEMSLARDRLDELSVMHGNCIELIVMLQSMKDNKLINYFKYC